MNAMFLVLALMLGDTTTSETNGLTDLQIAGNCSVPVAINSQYTYTLFSDGHTEEVIYYTDGTHYTYPAQSIGRLPRRGDVKHREWVWRNNQWVLTVDQYY